MHAGVKSAAGGIAALGLALVGTIVGAGGAQATVVAGAPLVINEVYGGGGNSGAPFDRDFVELYNPGTAPVALSGWAVQYASTSGSSWQKTVLTGGTLEPGDFLVVGEAFGSNTAAPDVPVDVEGTIPMGGAGGKVALTSDTASLACSSGCALLPAVVDLVGWGSATDFAGTGAAPATTNATSVSRSATHANTADNAADFTAGAPTPTASGTGPGGPGTPTEHTIAEIQGTGAASPLVGTQVVTSGVVTAAYPTGGLSGYVIQTPGTGGASDPTPGASDAIFVFSSATVDQVRIGDSVKVTGAVSEFNGLTELTVAAGGLEPLHDPVPAVTPVAGGWPTTDAAREALESMLFTPTGDFTVSNTFSTNQYGEVGLAAGTTPLLQPTEVGAPGSAEAAAAAADDAARGVVLDDGASTNFLSAANQSQTPPYVSLANPVRVGEAVTFSAPLVVDFRNNVWKLNPTAQVVAGLPAPVAFANDRTTAPDAAAIGGDLKVASFNVLNYFTTLGAGTPGCTSFNDRTGDPVTVNSGCNPRGAWDPADLQRQQDKIVAAINGLDADVVGLLEIENSLVVDGVADEAVGTLVDALNADAGPGTWAFVPSATADLPPVAQMDVINNAIIYRTAAVTRTGPSHALGSLSADDEAFGNAREPIAQAFTPAGGGEPFLVVVNHFKSKGSAGPWPGDVDSGDGQGASNESRVRQATALRDWVPAIQGGVESVALVGDFNSYTQEDPLRLLYDAGYTDAGSDLAPGQYSYSFGGLSGSLDHVLLNGPALARATGADIWEINAEESIALEYSRYNYHGTLFYAADPYRSSDHDPVVVGLVKGAAVPVNLTLLDINDFHGRIDANTVKFAGTVEKEKAAAIAAGDPVAFVSAGDNVSASLFASAVQQDQPTIDVLNALELNASAVGNHEFDKGFADLRDRIIAGGTNATWDYLGANVYEAGTTTPALPEYALIDMDGVTVGIIGAVTEETPSLVSPGGITELSFGDPVEAVNRVAGELTDGDPSNGEADVLVASFHEGASEGTPDGATLEEEVAAGGAFAEIVNDTSPAVDAIFTGHTHKQYAWEAPVPGQPGKTRPILQTGSYGDNIGKIVLTYDPSTDEVLAHTQTNVPRLVPPAGTSEADFAAQLAATYPRVAEVKRITDAALAYANEVGSVPVGSVTDDITTAFSGGTYTADGYVGPGPTPTSGRDDRASESTLGDLVANALRDTLAPDNLGGAQIGVVNPGGLRAELLYAPDGVVTTAEANSVLPFVNNLWTTSLTGAQVKTMLEQQWQTNPDGTIPTRPYLQLGLSDNVTYTYDAAAPMGSHITSITVDGVPLDPAASYRIGTFSFLVTGGDNFRVFTEGTDARDSGLVDRDGWIAYLQAHPDLAPDFARQAVGVPVLPASVTAGDTLAFPVTKLDLTSLGSPQNTSLDVRLDGTSIGSAPVTGGNASVSVTVPSGTGGGAHTLTLVAAPSGTTVTLPLTVEEALPASTTTLTAAPARQVYGTSKVKLKATVTSTVPVSGPVEFVAGDTVLGTATLSKGKATLTLPASTPAGTYEVVARFAGDDTVTGSQSEAVTVVVDKVTTRTSLTVTPGFLFVPSFAVATVSTDNGRFPSGKVEIREGGTVVKSLDVVLGIAIGTVPSGRHTYTATFVPDDPANVSPSTSRPVSTR
ncbi:multifunctional nuclease/2',3'-cyclic-nucleotide 2'-phosphodiesterase/5'-nucleotidase/3'-nucleotidase [Cellulomonas chitinilytica]|uniref:Multifunctional nuclease/2',3'-cyclic-nucleotide 2'-phosphodiesterase/5'-nucleotidase/3'-nucleotidase n=1 Tax=Cellulomonas chitinilytica TaxID=398759 RepID=A0A919P6F2_9CELL|nr:ExeM/NucH family extracellular endonuclease [Cellulomonas chitinilytica]GIG23115.1 multifunctional nuclease/2',3'-cyclic-nucleotide 2'-phosphodiesterase/5'-nucleotidase/3'-nucleotidase [Cellulomonas chitinilytica]